MQLHETLHVVSRSNVGQLKSNCGRHEVNDRGYGPHRLFGVEDGDFQFGYAEVDTFTSQ